MTVRTESYFWLAISWSGVLCMVALFLLMDPEIHPDLFSLLMFGCMCLVSTGGVVILCLPSAPDDSV